MPERREPFQPRRVVITGIGAVTSMGANVEAIWKGCLSGCSGISPITSFDTSGYPTRIAAEIKEWDPTPYFESRKDSKRVDKFVQFAVAAARMALQDAGLTITEENRDRVGVFVGSGIGGLATIEEYHKVLLDSGPGRISPFLIPAILCNMGAGMVSIVTGARGPNSCTSTACTTGINNIGDAVEVIRSGRADVMIAGGSEACITPLGIAGFCAAKAMTTKNDDIERASRPFDLNRDGFVMGEGAGIVTLETLEAAQTRGANIYAEVTGYGMSGDAYHITSPPADGNGAIRSMKAAIEDAGIPPEQVDYINAHGTSTQVNDRAETAAIKSVFGDHAYHLAVSSTKSMTAHLLGASGALETIFCALALRDGIIPPTINYETPDPNCDLDYVPNCSRRADVQTVMTNSFGFGGHNGTLIFSKVY